MKLKFVKLHPMAKPPTKAYEGDLGYDLFSIDDVVLKPLKPTAIRTGIAVELPDGWGAFVKDRSSMALKGVHTLGGVIDNGYRGEIRVIMISLSEEIKINSGDKIAQLVPIPLVNWKVEEVEELSETERNHRGFGSSGKR